MKLSKKEKEKIEKQTKKPNTRDKSWIGLRPIVFKDKTKDKKIKRSNDKRMCKEYTDE